MSVTSRGRPAVIGLAVARQRLSSAWFPASAPATATFHADAFDGDRCGANPTGRGGYVSFGAVAGVAAALAAGAVGSRLSNCEAQPQPAAAAPSGARLSRLFHPGRVHPLLERHLPRAVAGLHASEPNGACAAASSGGASGSKALAVLVPLCGKSVDLPFLCERGFTVVGVEGVAAPVLEMRMEQRRRVKGFKKPVVMSMTPEGWKEGAAYEPSDEFQGARPNKVFKKGKDGLGYYTDSPQAWRGKVLSDAGDLRSLHVIEGNLLTDVTPELVAAATDHKQGTFDLVYDRVCSAALPPDSRPQYVAALSKLLRPGGRILMVAAELEPPVLATGKKQMLRAPSFHSLSVEELRALFPAAQWSVEVLEQVDSDESKGFIVHNSVVLITKHDSSRSSGLTLWRATKLLAAACGVGCVAVAAVAAAR